MAADQANAFVAQEEPWKLVKQQETLQQAHKSALWH